VLPTARTRLGAIAAEIDRSIAILALLSFISQAGVSIMLPLLPLYAVAVGASPAEVGLMVSAFSATSTIGQLGSGFLSTRISARRQMPLGQAVYATGNFLIATTTAALSLITFRALSGLGGGLTIIAERLYIARVTVQSRLAFTNGVVSAAGSSGSVLGPLLGALLALHDLRVPFFVVGCTATIAGVAAFLFLPAERPAAIEGTPPKLPSPSALPEAAELVPGVEGLGASSPDAVESSRWADAAPLVRLALWNLAFNAAYGSWITTFGPYSKDVLGLPQVFVQVFFAPFGLGAIVLGPILARLADRTGRRRMIAIGTVLLLSNIVALIVGTPELVLYATAIVAGGGLAAAQSSWFALLAVATDGGRRSRSFGLVSALSNLGVIAGAGAASAAWSTIGLREGMVSAAVFLVLAIVSLALVPSDRARG
jgi:MFS transporter, DHA1 family, multidrug resistance protein